jgi:site-specific DNA-methyltransferase (adenine-specific)
MLMLDDSALLDKGPGLVLPRADNTAGSVARLQAVNARYRTREWPAPLNVTRHAVRLGDARDLSWIPDGSVHLVVTSPPYWTLKKYEDSSGQLGSVKDYDSFLLELDEVWKECSRVLVKGGRVCCVVGDVCLSRRAGGRHRIMPLHADIQVRSRKVGLDCLTPILWRKIANGATEVEGNGAGFYGKPYQPGAIVKNDVEYVVFLRKPGEYRKVDMLRKALSMLTKPEMQSWVASVWSDIKGASTRDGHPAPYPVELAERLVRLFSFAGDTVLDPFLGSGSTSVAAIRSGRNSIGVDIEPKYLELAKQRILTEAHQPRFVGATRAIVV